MPRPAYKLAFRRPSAVTLSSGQWDATKHPRGHEGNPGQFRAKESPEATPAQAEGSRPHLDKARAHLDNLIHASKTTLPAKRTEYARTMHEVLGRFPEPMLERIAQRVGEVKCFHSVGELTDELYPAQGEDGHVVGGSWWEWKDPATGETRSTGTLNIDGGYDSVTAEEIYAHELGHVVDFDREMSDAPEWREAWKEEIDAPSKPLSDYACVNPSEGFAEFVRAVTEHGPASETLEEFFPKCLGFLGAKGLI